MDKVHKKRYSGYKKAKIGVPLGVYDKTGREFRSGDKFLWGIKGYENEPCIVLWDEENNCYGALLMYSRSPDSDMYDARSYGKWLGPLPMDNGAKQLLQVIA